MNLRALGEFGLIEAIRRRAGASHPQWRVAIGDDAAVLTPKRGEELVLTADTVVENVHFRWRTTTPALLGRKALAVNLSDVGAMGARPLGFLLTLGLPRDMSGKKLEAFLDGLFVRARIARCPLVGGDVTRAGEFSAAITAIGAVTRGRALLRSAARPGDRVMVTGRLGAAAAGLRAIERRKRLTRAERPLARRQRAPFPPFWAGPELVRLRLSRCAIDVSDGLAQDLGHVLDESRVGARIALEAVPVAAGATLDDALGGGEDYELLFTVSPRAPSAEVIGKRLACRVTEIGVITRQRRLVLTRAGRAVDAITRGYEHFKASSARSDK